MTVNPGRTEFLEPRLAEVGRRLHRGRMVGASLRAFFWGGVGALLLGLFRWAMDASPIWLPFLFVFPFALAGLTLFWQWRRGVSPEAAARYLDEKLDARDRFRTAWECVCSRIRSNQVTAELLKRADAECRQLQPRRIVRHPLPREARGSVVIVLIFAVWIGWTVVAWIRNPLGAAVQPLLRKELVRLEKAVTRLEKTDDPRKREIAEKLRKMMEELEGARSVDELIARGRKILDVLERQSSDPAMKQTLQQLGRVAQYLSKSGYGKQLAEAIQKGDMRKAADLTRTLAEQVKRHNIPRGAMKKLANQFLRANATLGTSSSGGT